VGGVESCGAEVERVESRRRGAGFGGGRGGGEWEGEMV